MKRLSHKKARTKRELKAGGGRCWISGDTVIHMPDCRPARPLCKWMREVQDWKYGVCTCAAYPWPHRRGSGCCGTGYPWGLTPEEEREFYEEKVPF